MLGPCSPCVAPKPLGLLQHSGELPSVESTTVGNFLAIVSKRSVLIGFVTQVSVEIPEIVRHQGYSASARLDLMGEIRTEAGGSRRFLRGITQYPHIGDPVVTIGSNELRVVYGNKGMRRSASASCNRIKRCLPIYTSTR